MSFERIEPRMDDELRRLGEAPSRAARSRGRVTEVLSLEDKTWSVALARGCFGRSLMPIRFSSSPRDSRATSSFFSLRNMCSLVSSTTFCRC